MEMIDSALLESRLILFHMTKNTCDACDIIPGPGADIIPHVAKGMRPIFPHVAGS